MANYSQLKAAIADVIKTNGTQAITGQVLQDVLNSMVSVIGANYTFAGVATPATNPGTPDQNVVYFASQAGTYTNFGGIELPAGISLLVWNGTWSSQTFFVIDNKPISNSSNLVNGGGIYNGLNTVVGYIATLTMSASSINSNRYVNYDTYQDTLTIPVGSYILSYKGGYSFNPSEEVTINLHNPSGNRSDWAKIVYHIDSNTITAENRSYSFDAGNDILLGYKLSLAYPNKKCLMLNAVYRTNGKITEDSIPILDAYRVFINDYLAGRDTVCSTTTIEPGGMTITAQGGISKYNSYGGQYNSRARLTSGSIHLYAGSSIVVAAGADLYVGGKYDDGTAITNSWKINSESGGTYLCAKDGTYAIIIRYHGEPAFDNETYTLSDLASHITIKQAHPVSDIQKQMFAKQFAVKNIAHQGFNPSASYGYNLVSSYVRAAEAGFDYGETDIQFTSDGVPVCCHDDYFTDIDSGNQVTISTNTLSYLQSLNYHGETIATLDEVVGICKKYGMGLYLDKISNVNTDARWQSVFSILKKYKMEEKVVWLTNVNNKILELYPQSSFAIIPSNANTNVNYIVNLLTSLHSQYPDIKISCDVNYTYLSVANIISINGQIPYNTSVEVWTIDDGEIFENYLPYVTGITSNKFNELIVN